MPTASSSKAFTLFELLLVVVLISAMYGVFVHKLSTAGKVENKQVTLTTLKPFLQEFPFQREAELLCLEPCKSCSLLIDGKPADGVAVPLFGSTPKVYEKDRFGQLRQKEFLPYRKTDGTLSNVCFAYSLYKNGSSSSYVVNYQERYYAFDAYFGSVVEASSLSELERVLDTTALLPTEKRSYNY